MHPKSWIQLKGCFYMAKYTIDYKLEVLDFYKENTFSETIKVYNISNTALKTWSRKYRDGTLMRKQNKKYTIEEKLEIIDFYKNNGKMATEEKYNISISVVRDWLFKIEAHGESYFEKEYRGRPKKNKSNKNINEDLVRENQRLKLEIEYLKKLNSLDQKKPPTK